MEIEGRVSVDSTAAAVWRDLQCFFENARGDSIATDGRRNDEHALWLVWKKIIKGSMELVLVVVEWHVRDGIAQRGATIKGTFCVKAAYGTRFYV